MKIAAIQMDIVLGNVAANQKKALAMIEEGLRAGAKLFVLPEMWTTGYKLRELEKLAEPENGPSIQKLRSVAKQNKVEIIAGSIAEIADGKIYNTAYAINRTGDVVAKYRKIHMSGLANEEKYVNPGTCKCAFDLSFGKAGLIICYDIRFTELPRALALGGCEALFVPAEWPAVRGKHWRALNIARAIENQMFVIAVNRVGKDESDVFFGHSLVIDPWGEVLAEGSEERAEVVTADADFGSIAEIRKRIPVFADRRPECY
ncbi:MAG: carbon-nitrogen family hydrolase [Terriglobia bacterium]